MRHRRYEVSREHPIHILFPLPTESGRQEVNPFGITIDKARPVVDEAIEEVYRRQLIETGSIEASFEDSKLSDAHGPNVAINQLVDNRLDCIIGESGTSLPLQQQFRPVRLQGTPSSTHSPQWLGCRPIGAIRTATASQLSPP
jgi:hypothetical protein